MYKLGDAFEVTEALFSAYPDYGHSMKAGDTAEIARLMEHLEGDWDKGGEWVMSMGLIEKWVAEGLLREIGQCALPKWKMAVLV